MLGRLDAWVTFGGGGAVEMTPAPQSWLHLSPGGCYGELFCLRAGCISTTRALFYVAMTHPRAGCISQPKESLLYAAGTCLSWLHLSNQAPVRLGHDTPEVAASQHLLWCLWYINLGLTPELAASQQSRSLLYVAVMHTGAGCISVLGD